MEILIKRLDDNAKLPAYSSEAGPEIDLYAIYGATIEPGAKIEVSTGVALALPTGFMGQIWNKAGVTTETPIQVTPSIIDSGYRNEIKIEMINEGSETLNIEAGEKIAQLLVQKVERAHLIEAEDLSEPLEG